MIEIFSQTLKTLRVASGTIWTDGTKKKAPHKPLLLLSVLDLIEQGEITSSVIYPSSDLLDTFNRYCQLVMPQSKNTSMAYPFSRIRNDGDFWRMIPHEGYSADFEYNINSMSKLKEIYVCAIIDQNVFALFQDPESRNYLRNVIISHYFSKEVGFLLRTQYENNLAASDYSRDLLRMAEEKSNFDTHDDREQAVRDQGFRKTIVKLYEHRCALCGIRLRTPEGHTMVEAAHIVPWCESKDDRPVNGLCLCRLCHWSFDQGLMSVDEEYQVLVSDRVRSDNNMPGHILTLISRGIIKPENNLYWPSLPLLASHRRKHQFG
jgi:putative restriction endonuclease